MSRHGMNRNRSISMRTTEAYHEDLVKMGNEYQMRIGTLVAQLIQREVRKWNSDPDYEAPYNPNMIRPFTNPKV